MSKKERNQKGKIAELRFETTVQHEQGPETKLRSKAERSEIEKESAIGLGEANGHSGERAVHIT